MKGPALLPTLAEIFQPIATSLKSIETQIGRLAGGEDPLVSETVAPLISAGGKRIRPALVLLAGEAIQRNRKGDRDLVPLAAAVEVLHMATLVHDDVVDESMLRRGVSTMNSVWDNKISVIAGDYLYASASQAIIQFGIPRISEIFSQVVKAMCVGEVEQLTQRGGKPSIEAYLSRVEKKTAGLMAASAQAGGIAGGATEDEIVALGKYGLAIGMAFQIKDDLLDITGSQEVLGKPVLHDIAQENLTAPFLFALEEQPFQNVFSSTSSAAELSKALGASSGIARTEALCQRYILEAQEVISAFPASAEKESLQALAQFVIHRAS